MTDDQLSEIILQFARTRGPNITLTYAFGKKPTGVAMNFARAVVEAMQREAELAKAGAEK
jgi:hypothetical protein